MHDPVLIDIPYWYEANVVRHRCRVEDDEVLLRTTTPFAMPHLTREEAPNALTVKMEFAPERRRGAFSLTWRSDGESFLRPLHVHFGERPAGTDLEFYGSGHPMTLAHLRAILDFGADFDFSRHELPDCWLFDRNPKLCGIRFKGKRVNQVAPLDIETPEAYEASVKRWVWSKEGARKAETLRDAQRYLLVDGIVHRRVPAPVWSWSGIPHLAHGETLSGREPLLMWPLGLTEDFDTFLPAVPRDTHSFLNAEVEYHLKPNLNADLARIGGLNLQALWKYIIQAAPHLGDGNLDRYKSLRALRAGAMSFADCVKAFLLLEATLPDPGWDTAKKYASDHIRHVVAQHVAHWRRLLHAAGTPILDEAEDEALASLAV